LGGEATVVQEHSDILLTLAEVAVAFVGFAGIASVFARRLDQVPNALVAVRLRGMVDTGLAACFAAVLPLVVASYPLSASATWQLSSLGFAGVFLFVWVIAQARLRRMAKAGVEWGTPLYRRTLWGVWGTIMTLLLANAGGLSKGLAGPLYLTALLVTMVLAGTLFIRVLLILVPTDSPR
jgi:hypothetical protein